MRKIIYESPRFDFQEMHLMEKIAGGTCWTQDFWLDHDANTETESIRITKGTVPCANNGQDATARMDWLVEKYSELNGKLKTQDVHQNITGSNYVITIES